MECIEIMREEEKNTANTPSLNGENSQYSEPLAIDYCGFRLKSLAKKIKSECLKFKKPETRFINP